MRVRREQGKNVHSPLFGLVPYFVTWIFVPLYLYLQPIILYYHLIPFVFYVGLINAYSVGLIIIAHLTKNSEFPMYNVLTLPLGLAVIDSMGPVIGLWPSVLGFGTYQITFVFMCMGLSVGVYGSFVVSTAGNLFDRCLHPQYDIITTICDYLDIWCLTIKYPYVEKGKSKKTK